MVLDRAPGLPAVGGVVLAGAVIAVGSTYDPRYCLLGLGAVALVVLTLANLTYGVVALTLLAFFERLPGLSGVPLSKPLGLVLVISWLLTLAQGRENVPLLTRDHTFLSALLIALVAWGACSAAWATDPVVALTSALRLAMVVVLFFIVYTAVRTRRDLLLVTWAYLIGASMIAAVSLATGRTVEGRLSGGVLDPNFLAAALASSIIIASFLLPSARTSTRAVLMAFIGIYGIALVLTQSRGGLLATAVALLVACIVAGPVRAQTTAIVVLLSCVALTYFAVLAPASIRERATDVSKQGSASRVDTWQIALRIAGDHPFLGAGLSNFPIVESDYIPDNIELVQAKEVLNNRLVTHNTYLEILSELGFVGLGLFLGVICTTFAVAWSGIRSMGSMLENASIVSRGLMSGTLGLLVAYIFLSGEYEKQLWLLLGLLAAVPNVVRDSAQTESSRRRNAGR